MQQLTSQYPVFLSPPNFLGLEIELEIHSCKVPKITVNWPVSAWILIANIALVYEIWQSSA